MNMKVVYLQSKVRECCSNARRAIIVYGQDGGWLIAAQQLEHALAYARQMPDNSKWRAQRAYLAQALETLK